MYRVFAMVAPGAAGDIPYLYLRGLVELGGRAVRALPLGPASAWNHERRWYELGHLFTEPMSIPFANIVIAPGGAKLGVRATATSLGGQADLEKMEGRTRDVMVFPPAARAKIFQTIGTEKAHDDVVYEPESPFVKCWTAKVVNVAILMSPPTEEESYFLDAKYDLVLAPYVHATPIADRTAGLADQLLHIEGTCFESATSASTASSPATDARRATIAQRLRDAMTSSSRSSSSATSSSLPRDVTAISMASWRVRARRTISRVRWAIGRTWRSFTSRLAFWRSRRSKPRQGPHTEA